MKAPWPTEKNVLRRWLWIMHLEDMPVMSRRDGAMMRWSVVGATIGLFLILVGLVNAQSGHADLASFSLSAILGVVSLGTSLLGVGILWGKYTTLAEQSGRRLDRLEEMERQIVPRTEIDRRLENIEVKLASILQEVRR